MNRFHVHVSVEDLDQSVRFYSRLFGAEPVVSKPDYAKWMLEDPRVNFAISHGKCGSTAGLNHFGLQVDTPAELDRLEARFEQAGLEGVKETGATCCYARSDKTWLKDPQGTAWEIFHTLGSVPEFGDRGPDLLRSGDGCSTSGAGAPTCSPAVAAPACGPKAKPGCCG